MIFLLAALAAPGLPVVTVDRDNVRIMESCTVAVGEPWIADADGNGVVQFVADGITVDFAGAALHGADPSAPADAFSGFGVRVTATRVTLRNARISGYKTAIYASSADGLVVEDCDLSGNFRQRLKSTPQAEDRHDWLRPHANDGNEWLSRYGAAVYIEESTGVTVRRLKVRKGQNGIVLDQVNESEVYDNDCSFLSGWGLALWRSNRNVLSHNALDFCIRGYSHGVYNRGQDSAGILLFEQCSDNIIAENSATHCGDGLFCFAGRAALGQTDPRDGTGWYKGRGCNRNLILDNDFSHAAAHGIEVTFSFGNQIIGNRLVDNSICGLWAGYSQETHIARNTFIGNGRAPHGAEGGGINIEHGRGNRIDSNVFIGNACGIVLWWDPDDELLATPWCRANERGSSSNTITANLFRKEAIAVQLRETTGTTLAGNRYEDVETRIETDERSACPEQPTPDAAPSRPDYEPPGQRSVIAARRALHGRERIVMTEWGPRDWEEEE